MIDDPLSIVAAGIWLMAAGMYPIGFLFGACSDCCGECPDECSKCTHFYNNTSAEDHGSRTASIESDVFGSETRTTNSITNLDDDFVDPLIDITISIEDLVDAGFPECVASSLSLGALVQFRFVEILERGVVSDACGCSAFFVDLSFSLRINTENISVLWGTPFQSVNVNECAENTVSASFSEIENAPGIDFGDSECDAEVAQWIGDNFSASIVVDVASCDCGACCSSEPLGCEITAEGYCVPDDNTGIYREYQGDDTVCDPDPCVTGACCEGGFFDHACTVKLQGDCGGVFNEGVTCEPSPCLGACCDQWAPGGCTEDVTQDECDGDEWLFGAGCEDTCFPPLGSCCEDGNCTETTQEECGGTWTEGQRCDPNPC